MAMNLLDTIVRDHANMRRLLDLLDRQLDAVEAAETVDYALLTAIADYLLDYPDRFHHPIEDRIVDAIVGHNAQAGRPAVLYRAEHADLHDRAASFDRRVREVASDVPTPRAAFAAEGRRFSSALREHLAGEDRHFLPLARRYLDDAELARIAQSMPPPDDPLFGSATQERYDLLFAAIAPEAETKAVPQVSP